MSSSSQGSKRVKGGEAREYLPVASWKALSCSHGEDVVDGVFPGDEVNGGAVDCGECGCSWGEWGPNAELAVAGWKHEDARFEEEFEASHFGWDRQNSVHSASAGGFRRRRAVAALGTSLRCLNTQLTLPPLWGVGNMSQGQEASPRPA